MMNELNTPDNSVEPTSTFSLRMKLYVAALLLLLLGGIGYSSYSYIKNAPMREFDAAVAGVDIEKIADMEVEERKTFFETMKTIRDKMSDSQKKSNDDKNAQRMNEQFKEKFGRFFSSSPEEQRKALDKDIDRMASMMKGFMSGKGGFGPPGMGGPGAGMKPADNSAKNTPSPNGPNVKGKGAPTPEERNKRLSDGLDKSTPEMRAQMTEYWVRMNQRVKERGVQMIPFLGGFGGPKPK
ncbi:MAG: hypothetical protein DWH70_01430 [Planctomycetota bacterium]|nr:MAG: hypothetical protein DWH70_01430 [Planctomycetota bacterium]